MHFKGFLTLWFVIRRALSSIEIYVNWDFKSVLFYARASCKFILICSWASLALIRRLSPPFPLLHLFYMFDRFLFNSPFFSFLNLHEVRVNSNGSQANSNPEQSFTCCVLAPWLSNSPENVCINYSHKVINLFINWMKMNENNNW